jgi:hypothetical protein
MFSADTIADRLRRAFRRATVRERVVVREVNAAERRRLRPGFVIGVYRSGTTLLRFILDSHPGIAVPPESNFLVGAAQLLRDDWYRRGLAGVGVDDAGLVARLRDFAGDIFDTYALAKGKRRWFDKTPAYVEILDFIDTLFGAETRYIMLYRHGLDVATSMSRMQQGDVQRGPGKRYVHLYPDSVRLCNAAYWAEQCERMMFFEAAHPDRCHRLLYEDLATDPARHLPRLFEFLEEPWDPVVLRFSERSHDYGLQDDKILETRGFQPSVGTWGDWPAGELERARKIVGPVLAKLGYRA